MTAAPRVLLCYAAPDQARWVAALRRRLPAGSPLTVWPQRPPGGSVDYGVLWQPPAALLREVSIAKAVFSLGAGADHLLGQEALPAGVPLVRLVDPLLTEGMSHFGIYQVLRIHRGMARYQARQRRREWRAHRQRPASARRIGILGLGVLGVDLAVRLAGLGFPVTGWSRRPRSVDGVSTTQGPEGLQRVLASSDILLCLLPSTAATRGLLDAAALARLPRGAWVVNLGRGDLIDEAALLAAIDGEQLGGACLDVFREEPLPAEHPFWRHPRVEVTPHVASLSDPDSACAIVSRQLLEHWQGGELHHLVDRAHGY